MNLILVSKLPDSTLFENVLCPLLKVDFINKIYILRDTSFETSDDRISFLCPRTTSSKSRHIWKIVKGVYLCRNMGIGAILGVLSTPHGFIGMAIHMLSGVPYIHMTIAGKDEFTVGCKLEELFKLWLFRKARFITVTGKNTYNYLLGKGFDINKIRIMPNLPNQAFGEDLACSNSNKKYDIISFSSIDKNKNIQLLVNALSIIKVNRPINVVIAGEGDELDNLKFLTRQLNLDDSVHFVGYVRGTQNKINYFVNSKIFISCSRAEGFPVSLLEAVSCGCVPVVSNVGDISDVIKQWVNGVMFDDTENPIEIARILEILINDSQLLLKMSAESLKIKTTISIDENAEKWSGMLSEIQRDNR